MKNLHLIVSTAKNYYFYNKSSRYLGLIPAEMYTIISKEIGNQEDSLAYPASDPGHTSYYARKVAYLKAHGLLDETPWQHQLCKINAEDVKSALAGTLQVTFEVTDGCNLKCTYCGFGEMYQDYDAREGKSIWQEEALALLRELCHLWELPAYAAQRKVNIGFYGGEPLLNMPFIERVVEFLQSRPCVSRTFEYSMTTNALLLDRHMDFLAAHDFHLLISLDGNAENSAYRVGDKGRPLFDRIIRNIDNLQAEYPAYFSRRVRFNTVLHDKNSVEEAYRFIKTRYGKAPRIGTLNPTGVREEKQGQFDKMYKSSARSLNEAAHREEIVRDMFPDAPGFLDVFRLVTLLFSIRPATYNELMFQDTRKRPHYPTGVCFPFSRKLFMSVNGKLLPCEKIGHQFALGRIRGSRLDLSFEEIAGQYNKQFSVMWKKCEHCYRLEFCAVCLFEMYDEKGNLVCDSYMDVKHFLEELRVKLDYLEGHTKEYGRFAKVRIV